MGPFSFFDGSYFDVAVFLCHKSPMWPLPQESLLAIALAAAVMSLLLLASALERRAKFRVWRGRKLKFLRKPSIVKLEVQPTSSKVPEMQRILYASFQKKRIMNKEEYGLFLKLERMLENNAHGLRLFTQVPLGEILRSDDSEAFFSINSKRCDFVVIDRNGEALIAIEYHGSGHFQGNSSQRDEVKRLALKKASIPTVEVLVGYQWNHVEIEIKNALGLVFGELSHN